MNTCIHLSVNITIPNMFMSCKQVALRNKPKPVDIDKFGGILTCFYLNYVLFCNGHPSYEQMSRRLSRKINTSEKNQN